jgi:hypothetical protein
MNHFVSDAIIDDLYGNQQNVPQFFSWSQALRQGATGDLKRWNRANVISTIVGM